MREQPLEPTAIYTRDGAPVPTDQRDAGWVARPGAASSATSEFGSVAAVISSPLVAVSMLGVAAATFVKAGELVGRAISRRMVKGRRMPVLAARGSAATTTGWPFGLVEVSWMHVEIRVPDL